MREVIWLICFASPNFTNFAAVHFFGSSCFNINICICTIRYQEDFDKKIIFQNEDMSSIEAEDLMKGDIKYKRDGRIDSIAAKIILDRYLCI